MDQDRVFDAADHFTAGEQEPPRIVITQSEDSAVVCWHVEPGQRIEIHAHPTGQDTWVVLAGEGVYYVNSALEAVPIGPGFVAIARRGQVHGALNTGTVPLRFVSVVAPAESGFELAAGATSGA